MQRILFGAIIGLLLRATTFAQPLCAPPIQWQNEFGGSNGDFVADILQTTDGGYVFAGTSRSTNGNKTSPNYGGDDYWIVKLDSTGAKLWEQSFGGSDHDELRAFRQTSDGGFILGGYSYSGPSGAKTGTNFGSADFWIVRLDSNGNKLWDKTFGGSDYEELTDIQVTADGGYILAGFSSSPPSGNKNAPAFRGADYWIVRLDSNGNQLWDRSFGGLDADILYAVQETADGGFLLAGASNSDPSGNKTASAYGGDDIWLVRLDASGTELWQRSYPSFEGSRQEGAQRIAALADGGFLLGGYFNSTFGVSRIDADGNLLWQKTYADGGFWSVSALKQTSDGGFVFGGPAGILVRINSTGDELWRKHLGIPIDAINGIALTSDGGFAIGLSATSGVGGNKTTPNFGGPYDAWIVKLVPEGSDCDSDDDGVADSQDQCPGTAPGAIVNADGCSIEQLSPCHGPWKNHGQYVRSVVQTTKAFLHDGLITRDQRHKIIREAAQSSCGKRVKAVRK